MRPVLVSQSPRLVLGEVSSHISAAQHVPESQLRVTNENGAGSQKLGTHGGERASRVDGPLRTQVSVSGSGNGSAERGGAESGHSVSRVAPAAVLFDSGSALPYLTPGVTATQIAQQSEDDYLDAITGYTTWKFREMLRTVGFVLIFEMAMFGASVLLIELVFRGSWR